MKNNFPVFGILTLLLLLFRIILNKNAQLVYVVSVINLIALLIVVFSISKSIKAGVSTTIHNSGVPQEIIDREIKETFHKLDLLIYLPLAIIVLLYLVFLSSQLGNDIIAIVALGLSVSDSYIADIVINSYK